MPKKSPAKTKKTASTKAGKQNPESRYQKLRSQIESMKELHAVVLVIMVVLIASMFLLMAKQKRQIDELSFKVNFLQDRYEFFRTRAYEAVEMKNKDSLPE